MRYCFFVPILLGLFWVSCGHEKGTEKVTRVGIDQILDGAISQSVLETLDTTIFLSGLNHSNYDGPNLSNELAKKVLYKHYGKMGVFNSENLPKLETLTEEDTGKTSVDFDSIYTVDLNENKFLDAVITYWVTPLYASGHCFQPHRAIIVDTDRGYQITNEDFIPTNFAIDSIIDMHGEITVFGFDYECANNVIVKNLRVHLK